MTTERENMLRSLNGNVIPILRKSGFRGSFPHFYRKLDGRIDLLMFQFSAWGGILYVEISKCAPSGHLDVSKKLHLPGKVKVYDIDLAHRERLGKEVQEMFRFNKDNTEGVSLSVRESLGEAEEWWNTYPNWWNEE